MHPASLQPTARDPQIMGGELCFTGTRVPFYILFDYLESETLDDFLIGFPSVRREQALAVLQNAYQLVAVSG